MCYTATQTSKAYEYQNFYSASMARLEDIEIMQTWYKAYGFDHPKLLVLLDRDGNRELELQQWGLMPSWNKPLTEMLKIAKGTLNARAETIRKLSSFKNSIKSQRCIIPVNSFFEYKHVGIGKKKQKLPYLIHPVNQPYFNLAGIYSHYLINPKTKEWLTTFAIITEPANTFMADIHNRKEDDKRMPLMISNEMISDWINPASPPGIIDEILGYRCDDSDLAAYRIRQDLKTAENDESVLLPIAA